MGLDASLQLLLFYLCFLEVKIIMSVSAIRLRLRVSIRKHLGKLLAHTHTMEACHMDDPEEHVIA